MAVNHNSPKRERKEYMYYTTEWEAKNWLGNTIRHTHEAEGKYTQQTKEINTRLNPQTGEHIQDISYEDFQEWPILFLGIRRKQRTINF